MKAVIFDLDGTLLNTIPDIRKAINAVLEDYGYAELSDAEIAKRLGHGFQYLVNNSLPADVREELLPEALMKFEYYYNLYYMDETRPYPGIHTLLRKLQAKGILLGVNSNKKDEYTKSLIQHVFPDISFVDVIGMREGIPAKPNPTNALTILSEMNVSGKDAIYVGDSGADCGTAKNADLPFLAVSWGFRSVEKLQEAGAIDFAYSAEDIYYVITGEKVMFNETEKE